MKHVVVFRTRKGNFVEPMTMEQAAQMRAYAEGNGYTVFKMGCSASCPCGGED